MPENLLMMLAEAVQFELGHAYADERRAGVLEDDWSFDQWLEDVEWGSGEVEFNVWQGPLGNVWVELAA